MPGKNHPRPGKKRVPKKAARHPAARRPGRMAAAMGRSAIETWLRRVKPGLQPLARRLDQLILEAMPDAVCAIKWGVPFYGLSGQGWITAINSFQAHVKLLFFRGGDLTPALPAGKGHNAMDFHSYEELLHNESLVKSWLQQARKLPGWLRV